MRAANIVFDKSDNALEFADNAKAVFGTGGDLEISHNGSNSIINDAGTGDLLLQLGGSTKFSLNSSGAEVHGDIIIADKIIHDGDTNTAIRFPAADTVAVETGGSERFRVDSSGQIGMGESSPAENLHIRATSNVGIRLDDSGQSYANFIYNNGSNSNDALTIAVDEGNTQASSTMRFRVDASEKARFTGGDFSIGDTVAGARLHVKGGGNGSGASTFRAENSDNTELFEIRNDGAVFTGDDGGSPINFTGGSANVHIDSNGRLKTVSSSKKYKQDIKKCFMGSCRSFKIKTCYF